MRSIAACGTIQACLNCKRPDCTRDYVRPPQNLTIEQLEREKARYALRRQYRRDHRLCLTCGKPLSSSQFLTCVECRIRDNRRHKKFYMEHDRLPRELLDGVERCGVCGRPKEDNDHKCCDRCYAALCKNIQHARAFRKENGAFKRANGAFWVAVNPNAPWRAKKTMEDADAQR